MAAVRNGLRSIIKTAFIAFARYYCLGDPNVRGRLRALHVLKALRGQRFRDIADAGCGQSGMLGWFGGLAFVAYPLSRFHRESRVYGLDIDPTIIQTNAHAISRTHASNLTFEQANLLLLPESRHFDAVVFSDIARDARRDGDFVRGVARLVRAGGRFVMICPTNHQLELGSTFRRTIGESGFTPDELRGILSSCGFQNIEVRNIIGPIAGRATLIGRRIAAVHYVLFVLIFPWLMTVSALDLLGAPKVGDAIVVTGNKVRETS